MITTVCLNPCMDRSISIAEFKYGGMNRVVNSRSDAGGKGVNVAVTSARLGLETTCISFLHRNGGKEIENKLFANGVSSAGIWLDGTLRTNLKVVDQSCMTVTEINESGSPVSPTDLQKMTRLILNRAQDSDFLVLSGSLPPGCPVDYYKTIIESTEGMKCRCVLDTDGERLHEGLKARPYLVKPNLAELEMLLGQKMESVEQVHKAALMLLSQGVSLVAVSLGGDGALVTNGEETLYAPPLEVSVKSTVGAGDAMIAGFTAGCLAELELSEIFRRAVACATASVMSEGTQPMDRALYRSLLDKIVIHML